MRNATAGGAGSVDTPHDVSGPAVKFYTHEGNWDLVGNKIPVFFIQSTLKFADLVHTVKMEAASLGVHPQAVACAEAALQSHPCSCR